MSEPPLVVVTTDGVKKSCHAVHFGRLADRPDQIELILHVIGEPSVVLPASRVHSVQPREVPPVVCRPPPLVQPPDAEAFGAELARRARKGGGAANVDGG